MTGPVEAAVYRAAAARLRAGEPAAGLELLEELVARPGVPGQVLGEIAVILRLWRDRGEKAAIFALERYAARAERALEDVRP